VFDTSHYGPLQIICSGFVDESMPKLCKERMLAYIDNGKIVRKLDNYFRNNILVQAQFGCGLSAYLL
jgi:hypothetical protein